MTINEASALLSAETALIDLKAGEEKSEVITNTLDLNANAGEELVLAMTMTSGLDAADKSTASIIERRHRDFIKNMITGAALHDKREMSAAKRFSQIAFPITVLPKDDRTDYAQEARLGLPYWTMI